MKRFLKKLIYFVLIVLFIAVLIESVFHKFRLTNFDIALSKSINNFEEVSDDIEVLFLGDSRTFYGINPITINSKLKTQNFSFPSEPIQTTYWKMKYYFDNEMLDSLKLAYILIDEEMLTGDSRIGLQTVYDYSKLRQQIKSAFSHFKSLNPSL